MTQTLTSAMKSIGASCETDGGDCDSLTTCEGMLVVTRSTGGVVCPDTAQWKGVRPPYPNVQCSVGILEVCEGDSIEICAERSCGVADGVDPDPSWIWDTTPQCESSSVNDEMMRFAGSLRRC